MEKILKILLKTSYFLLGAGMIFLFVLPAAAESVSTSAGAVTTSSGKSWQAFPYWNGAIYTGVGDLNANGHEEIVVTPGAGMGPHVRIFNSEGRLVGQFAAYNQYFRGGVYLAVGDINADGMAEIVTGAGPGGGPHVRVFNHRGEILNEWFAYDATYLGGVRVGIQNGEVVTWRATETQSHEMSVPLHKQEHNLSCEVASLRSALLYKGLDVSEAELIKYQPKSYPIKYQNGVWGDPSKGYVGDIDASQVRMTGYGIYWKPIAELARRYRPADYFRHVGWEHVKDNILEENVVIIWGNYHQNPQALIWQTVEGAYVLGFIGEHTYVVLGWEGDPNHPDQVILLDPMRGRLKMSYTDFMRNWSFLDYSGVVVK